MPAYAQRFSESQSRPSMRWLPPVLPTLTEVIRLEFLTVREFSPGMFQKPHSTDTYLLTLCHPIPAHLGWGEQGGRMLGRGLTTSAITKLPVILTYSRFESSGQYYRSSTLHNTLQRNVSLCDTLQKLQSWLICYSLWTEHHILNEAIEIKSMFGVGSFSFQNCLLATEILNLDPQSFQMFRKHIFLCLMYKSRIFLSWPHTCLIHHCIFLHCVITML